MNKIDLIIDALSVAQNSVWSALNQEALAYAIELKTELAKPEQELSTLRQVVIESALKGYSKPEQKPIKKWVGLTDDEIHKIINDCTPDQAEQEELNDFAKAVRFVEDALRKKNT